MPRIIETHEIFITKKEISTFLKLKEGESLEKILLLNSLAKDDEDWLCITTKRELEQIRYAK